MNTHYIYRTTDNLTGQYYIGKRTFQGDDPSNDPYMGSGQWIVEMEEKFGKYLSNAPAGRFTKFVIETCDDEASAYERERTLIDDALSLNLCKNIAKGGGGCRVATKKVTRRRVNMRKTYIFLEHGDSCSFSATVEEVMDFFDCAKEDVARLIFREESSLSDRLTFIREEKANMEIYNGDGEEVHVFHEEHIGFHVTTVSRIVEVFGYKAEHVYRCIKGGPRLGRRLIHIGALQELNEIWEGECWREYQTNWAEEEHWDANGYELDFDFTKEYPHWPDKEID